MRSETRRRHRDADRRSLLAAAEAVFSRKGFARASIRDIAAEAGFSVGGVYQFVRSKDALYLAVLEQIWRDYLAATEPALRQPTFDEQLLGLTDGTLRIFAARRAFMTVYMAERSGFTGAFGTRVARSVERHKKIRRAQIVKVLEAGRRARRLRFDDLDFLASAYLGLIFGLMLHGSPAGRRGPVTAPSADAVLSLFCGGITRPRSPSSK